MQNLTLVEKVEEKLGEFGLQNITEETVVTIDHDDYEVNVFETEFNTFTKSWAITAGQLVDFNFNDPDETKINHQSVVEFVNQI